MTTPEMVMTAVAVGMTLAWLVVEVRKTMRFIRHLNGKDE